MAGVDLNCKEKRVFNNSLDAEYCVRVLETETKKPHRVQASGMMYGGADINWWYTVDFYNCREGAVFTDKLDVSTADLAKQCADSLNRIETGGKTYKAILFKETGWFKSDHYKVVAE